MGEIDFQPIDFKPVPETGTVDFQPVSFTPDTPVEKKKPEDISFKPIQFEPEEPKKERLRDKPWVRKPVGFALKTLDLLSRPTYAVTGALSEVPKITERAFRSKEDVEKLLEQRAPGVDVDPDFNPFKRILRALKGEERITTADIAKMTGWQPQTTSGKLMQGVIGFGGDVILDPLAWTGLGGLTKAGRAAKLAKGLKILDTSTDASKILKGVDNATDIVRNIGKIDIATDTGKLARNAIFDLQQNLIKKGNPANKINTLVNKTLPKIINKSKEGADLIKHSNKMPLGKNIAAQARSGQWSVARLRGHPWIPGIKELELKTPKAFNIATAKYLRKSAKNIDELTKNAPIIGSARNMMRMFGGKYHQAPRPVRQQFLNMDAKIRADYGRVGRRVAKLAEDAKITDISNPNTKKLLEKMTYYFEAPHEYSLKEFTKPQRRLLAYLRGQTRNTAKELTKEGLLDPQQTINYYLKHMPTDEAMKELAKEARIKGGITGKAITKKPGILKERAYQDTIKNLEKEAGTNFFDKTLIKPFLASQMEASQALNRKRVLDTLAKNPRYVRNAMRATRESVKGPKEVWQTPPGYDLFSPSYGKDLWVSEVQGKALGEQVKKLKGKAVRDDVLNAMNEYFGFKGPGPLEQVTKKVYDPLYNLWKRTTLSIFPSYHARNTLDNISRNMLSGMNPVEAGDAMKKAYRVQLLEPKFNPSRLNKWLRKPGDIVRKGIDPNDIAVIGKGGKAYTNDDVLRIAKDFGVLDEGVYTAEILGDEALKTANPLMTKFQKGVKELSPVEAGREIGEAIENNSRLAHFIDKLGRGYTPEEAAQSTFKYLFNYLDISNAEKTLRRIFPFYTFSRKNLPFVTEMIATKPHYVARVKKVIDNVERQMEGKPMDEEILPEFIKTNVPIYLGRNEKGSANYGMLKSFISLTDIETFGRGPDWVLDNLTPFAKEALIQKLNYDPFFKREIIEYPGQKGAFFGTFIPVRLRHALRNIRAVGELEQLIGKMGGGAEYREQPKVPARILRTMTGLKTYPLEPIKQKRWKIFDVDKEIKSAKRDLRKASEAQDQGRATELRQVLIGLQQQKAQAARSN